MFLCTPRLDYPTIVHKKAPAGRMGRTPGLLLRILPDGFWVPYPYSRAERRLPVSSVLLASKASSAWRKCRFTVPRETDKRLAIS